LPDGPIMSNYSLYGYSHFGSIQALARIPPRSAKDAGSGTIPRHDRAHSDGRCSGIRGGGPSRRHRRLHRGSRSCFGGSNLHQCFPDKDPVALLHLERNIWQGTRDSRIPCIGRAPRRQLRVGMKSHLGDLLSEVWSLDNPISSLESALGCQQRLWAPPLDSALRFAHRQR
jgi:hypothetical protein